MSEEPPDTSQRTHDPTSWTFWRKRLARALIVGALVLGITQILPQLPQDQNLELRPPAGGKFTEVRVTYSSPSDTEALGASHVTLSSPLPSFQHTIRLSNGTYSIIIEARGVDSSGKPASWKDTRTVSLEGETVRIQLGSDSR